MKRHTLIVSSIVALIVLLCIVVSFVAQRDLQRRYVDQRFGQPVFREDLAIIAVTFESNINGHGTEPVPEENLQKIVNWLRQFKIGRIVESGAQLNPGSGSVCVSVTYADGSQQTTSLDSVQVQDTLYLINKPLEPDAMQRRDAK